jgi:hypothetical protein
MIDEDEEWELVPCMDSGEKRRITCNILFDFFFSFSFES